MAVPASSSSDSGPPSSPSPVIDSCSPIAGASQAVSVTIQNIGSLVLIKLTTTNYLTWSALFAPIFRRYNLTGMVDGSVPPSPQFVTTATGDSTLNPAYVTWFENDQNILIWINSTLSDSLIPYTVGVNSSRDLWAKLESRLATASQSHIHELRSRLRTLTKGDSSATQFLQQIEAIADALASAGAPIDDSELISVILHGFPSEYDSFVDAIQFRLGSTTIDELHGLLLSKEIQLTNRKQMPSATPFQALHSSSGILPTPPSQALLASHNSTSNFSSGRGSDRPPYSSRGFFSNPKNFQGRGNFRSNNFRQNSSRQGFQRNNRGGRSTFNSFGKKVSCQICQQYGHEAFDCPHRMNPNFSGHSSPSAMVARTNASSPTWLVDSGASHHMTNSSTNLQNPESYTGLEQVYVGDGKGLSISHSGSSTLHTPSHSFQLRNVLHVPDLTHNLLSVNKFLLDNWCSMHLYPFHFHVKDISSGKMLFKGPVHNGFYPFQSHSSGYVSHQPHACAASVHASKDIWHQRLGHPSPKIINKLSSSSCISVSSTHPATFCNGCAVSKSSRLPFVSVPSHTSKPLELIHTDVWGPASVSSVQHHRFYIIFVDDFTKYCWFFPMQYKSDAFSIFVKFKAHVENLLCTKILTLRSDAGGEFLSIGFSDFLVKHGITHQLSCPHTPEQNGCSERKHRHLVETTITLLAVSKVPFHFWDHAFATAVYLINRMPTVSKVSPWELLFHRSPSYQSLRIFGCSCFPWLQPYSKSKLAPKSTQCVFLGYSINHKGYKCLDLNSHKIHISRHVVFDESSFPYHRPVSAAPSSLPLSSTSLSPTIPTQLTFTTNLDHPASPLSSSTLSPSSVFSPSPLLNSSPMNLPSSSLSSPSPNPVINTHPMQTRSKSGIYKHKAFTATKHPLPPHLSPDFVPTTYLQASKHPHWVKAMQDEFLALQQTGTWSLVPPSQSSQIVGCKWVFRIKKHPDGTIDRYKARLVAKGFHQQEGLDYTETFSPVAKPVTIRLLLTLAAQYDWFLNQLDVSNAFLHGTLSENVFMHQPPGFADPIHPTHICHLRKSLYGLKQAPRAWYDKLHGALKSLGFSGSQSDHSLFVKHNPMVFILVYVDDIIATGPSPSACKQVITQLSNLFPIKDLGAVHYFLGIEVQRSSKEIYISQTKYILDLLQRAKMDGAKPCATPLSTSQLDHTSSLLDNLAAYRSLVGALQYLTWTRPDLSFAVNLVCQFMHTPRQSHFQAVKRILRYLKGTIDMGLWFPKQSFSPSITAFSDADWAGCSIDRKSTSGYCIFLGSSLISWSAKKQPTVARSSTEAKYRSLANTAAELTWIGKLLTDIGYTSPLIPKLWCDNLSALSLAKNPLFHARTKHVKLDYHYIREKVLAHAISVHYVSTKTQLADICTKALSKDRFQFLRSKLSLRVPQFGLRGDIKGIKGNCKNASVG